MDNGQGKTTPATLGLMRSKQASVRVLAFLGASERFVKSPTYPTTYPSLLGFHQFYWASELAIGLLTTEQVADIEASTLSIAQVLTGQIVLYATEMGVDASIIAFAAATPSNDLYYPTASELQELSIASGAGLRPWFMEPYADGIVTAATPYRSDSILQQITAFCSRETELANLLITMKLATPSYPNPNDLPLNAVEIRIDGDLYGVIRRDLIVRYRDDKILITVPVDALKTLLVTAREIDFSLNAARVMGGF